MLNAIFDFLFFGLNLLLKLSEMRKFFVFFLLSIFFLGGYSQDSYFQQRVDYQIDVKLLDEEKMLLGFEKLIYTNNSPDTLYYIYFHLWPNAYSDRNTPLARQMAGMMQGQLHFNFKEVYGFVDSLNFKINGTEAKTEYVDKYGEICKVYLPEPLPPHSSVEISTPFRVKIPKLISRMGYTNLGFEISQWYPKPAVYDKYGWHTFPYLNQGEFYSEFGSFDVRITLPSDYVVAATGRLMTKAEKQWLEQLALANVQGKDLDYPTKQPVKTVRFYQDSIHDFAFFTSKYYYADFDTLQFKDRTVRIEAFFFGKNLEWNSATKYVKNAVRYYSARVGEYPYPVCTAVEGSLKAGGGMEYPTITVVSSSNIESVILHEVGHNWFYGILGFNEREYPFLDEGINSYYDHRWSEELGKPSVLAGGFMLPEMNIPLDYLMYQIPANFDFDQPLDLKATDYDFLSYSIVVYNKTALAFRYLRNYLGNDFDTIMHKFYETWKFKHPYPDDLENFFKTHSQKDVSWFFDYTVKTNGKIDYNIKYRFGKILLKNKGDYLAPVNFKIFTDSGDTTVWLLPSKKKTKLPIADYIEPDEKGKYRFEKIMIDPDFSTLEYYRFNDFYSKSGFFHNFCHKKDKFKLFPKKLDYYNCYVRITPVAYLSTDYHWRLGLNLTNSSFLRRKFSYSFMPIYAFGEKKWTGSLNLSWRKQPFKGFAGRKFNIYLDRFLYYDSDTTSYFPNPFRLMNLSYTFNLQNPKANDLFFKKLRLGLTFVSPTRRAILNIRYSMLKKSLFRPASFTVNTDFFDNTYVFWSEFTYKIHYDKLSRGLKIRLFLGSNVSPTGMIYTDDYALRHYFFDPLIEPENMYSNSGLAGLYKHQFVDNYGGITFLYPSKRYDFVYAVNLKSAIPKVPFVRIYGNVAFSADLRDATWFKVLNFQEPLWETGLMISLIPGWVDIYFPLYGSKILMDYNNSLNSNMLSHYRFTFKLEKLLSVLQ